MVKILPLISLVLIVLSAVCTIIGFSTYWYQVKYEGVSGSTVTSYYKYNKVKSVLSFNGDEETNTSDYDDIDGEFSAQLKFYKAALSMDILAFVNLFFSACYMGMAAFKEISPANQTKLKNSLNGATVFLIIATFVVLGLPKASREDCEDYAKDSSLNYTGSQVDDMCGGDNYKKFIGSHTDADGSKLSWGPTTAWIAIVVGLGIAFFNNIFVYCGPVFRNSKYKISFNRESIINDYFKFNLFLNNITINDFKEIKKKFENNQLVYNRILVDIKTSYCDGNKDEILFKIHEYQKKIHNSSSTTTGPPTTRAAPSTTTGSPTTHQPLLAHQLPVLHHQPLLAHQLLINHYWLTNYPCCIFNPTVPCCIINHYWPSTTHAASSTTTGPPATHAAPSITTGPHTAPLN
ncbi:hypothetical protein ACTFIR_007316 [Dictyostelium discoideum]